jgi:hypothetical protein
MPDSHDEIHQIYGVFPAGTFATALSELGFKKVDVSAAAEEPYTYKLRMQQEGNAFDGPAIETKIRDVVAKLPPDEVNGTLWNLALCAATAEGPAIAATIRAARVRP